MPDRYDSVIRQFRAMNVAEGVISPPSDWTTGTAYASAFLIPAGTISPESILKLRRLGVFGNFADGLVFKNAEEYLTAVVRLYGVLTPGTPVTGAYTSVAGDRTIGGVFTGVTSGSIIKFVPATASLGTVYAIATGAGTGTDIEVASYVPAGTGTFTVMQATVAGEVTRQYSIRTLNFLEEINVALSPGVDALANAEDVVMFGQLNQTGIDFLTKSVSPDFDGDIAYLDIVMELEYTEA